MYKRQVLDDILANDPDAHVACEVTACTGEVHLMGEITSSLSLIHIFTGKDLPCAYDASVCDSNILAVSLGIPVVLSLIHI